MNRNADVIQWLDSRLSKTLQFFAQEGLELNRYGYMAAFADLNLLAELLIKFTDMNISDDSNIIQYETQCVAIGMNIENEGKILPSDIEEYNSNAAIEALALYAAELQRILHANT